MHFKAAGAFIEIERIYILCIFYCEFFVCISKNELIISMCVTMIVFLLFTLKFLC